MKDFWYLKTARWYWRWFVTGIVTSLATLLLLLPALIIIIPLYSWLATRLGLPTLSWLEIAALVYLIRSCQATATINVPAESQPPEHGAIQ